MSEQQAPEQPQFAQVDVRFLQSILDYMKKRPYDEVYQFIEVLTGRAPSAPAPVTGPGVEPNISEVTPEGFNSDQAVGQ